MEQELPKPLVSDAKIAQYASQYVQPNAREVKRACEHVRDIYEAELQRLRSQVEAMRVAGSEMATLMLKYKEILGFTTAAAAWTASLNPTPTTQAK